MTPEELATAEPDRIRALAASHQTLANKHMELAIEFYRLADTLDPVAQAEGFVQAELERRQAIGDRECWEQGLF